MDQQEYWRIFHLVRGDVEAAIASNTVYFKIHNMAAADRDVLQKYNRTPEFWRLSGYALQTTFFISLGRVFDKTKDSLSIVDLIDATVEHPGFFSKASLRDRRLAAANGIPPDWLDELVARAWEPTRKDLGKLQDALKPHSDKFLEIYQPIRHVHFAHRGNLAAKDIAELFGKTLIGDATEILRFVYTLLMEIMDMHANGNEPQLDDFREYDSFVKHHSDQAEQLIVSIP